MGGLLCRPSVRRQMFWVDVWVPSVDADAGLGEVQLHPDRGLTVLEMLEWFVPSAIS